MLNESAVHDHHHPGLVDIKEPGELIYWMDLLHADADMLKEAVSSVGPSEELVREHLNEARLLH